MTNGNDPINGGGFTHTTEYWVAGYPMSNPVQYLGLTKRELFAYGAMKAIVSSIDSEENYQRLKSHAAREGIKVSDWIARDACKQADALIKALNDKP
jgi:hypothetical protein